MSDIGHGIVGSFNQAHLAARRTEKERSAARETEDDRVRDARRRFIRAQEEVARAQSRDGSIIDPDKENSSGTDARDQYEAHADMTARRADAANHSAPTPPANPTVRPSPDEDAGNLIDVEA